MPATYEMLARISEAAGSRRRPICRPTRTRVARGHDPRPRREGDRGPDRAHDQARRLRPLARRHRVRRGPARRLLRGRPLLPSPARAPVRPPRGWKHQNTRQTVVARTRTRGALQLTIVNHGQDSGAVRPSSRSAGRSPGRTAKASRSTAAPRGSGGSASRTPRATPGRCSRRGSRTGRAARCRSSARPRGSAGSRRRGQHALATDAEDPARGRARAPAHRPGAGAGQFDTVIRGLGTAGARRPSSRS